MQGIYSYVEDVGIGGQGSRSHLKPGDAEVIRQHTTDHGRDAVPRVSGAHLVFEVNLGFSV